MAKNLWEKEENGRKNLYSETHLVSRKVLFQEIFTLLQPAVRLPYIWGKLEFATNPCFRPDWSFCMCVHHWWPGYFRKPSISKGNESGHF